MKNPRPWLSATGVELQTEDLKQIAHVWNAQTWEAYLNWFQGGRREAVVSSDLYQSKIDELEESIFDSHGSCPRTGSPEFCEQLLSTLPRVEALVLRRYFLEGRTFADIAYELKRSRSGVCDVQQRALARLKRENSGDESDTRRYMRGADSLEPENVDSIWDLVGANAQLEDSKPLQPDSDAQFSQINDPALRSAMLVLSKTQQQILFASFWLKKSIGQIARDLSMGADLIEQLQSAAAFKFKQGVLTELKTQGGVS